MRTRYFGSTGILSEKVRYILVVFNKLSVLALKEFFIQSFTVTMYIYHYKKNNYVKTKKLTSSKSSIDQSRNPTQLLYIKQFYLKTLSVWGDIIMTTTVTSK